MNILDTAFLLFCAMVVLVCCYQGLLRSAFTFISFFLACILAVIFSPFVANTLEKNVYLQPAIISYTEGSEMLNEVDAEWARTPISQLSVEQVHGMIERGDFPTPLGSMVEKNIFGKVFDSQGVSQFSDYIIYTFAAYVMNVLAFWIVFFIVFIAGIIIIAIIDHATPFLVLRRFDRLAAGGVGILLSVCLSLVIVLFVPIVLFAIGQQIEFVRRLVEESVFISMFNRHNFFFSLIRSS